MDRSDKVVLVLIWGSVAITLAATAWLFMAQKDYTFIVEAACDPTTETCFSRDCTNPDDCPPNGLSEYKVFQVHAVDFEKCSDNSCADACASGEIGCTELKCGESEEDSCAEQPVESAE